MTEEEEKHLRAFNWFGVNDTLSSMEVTTKYLSSDPEMYEFVHTWMAEFRKHGFVKQEVDASGSGIWKLTLKGKNRHRRLRELKIEEDERKKSEETQRQLNIDVGRSTLKTNEAVQSIGVGQIVTSVIAIGVAVFAAWVAYKQMINETEREQKEEQEAQNTREINTRIDSLQKELNILRVIQTQDTAGMRKTN